MTETTDTIVVTVLIDGREYVRQVEGTHWARDGDRTLYVYDGDDTTILEVESEHVVEVFRENSVETIATIGHTDDTDTTTAPTTE